MKHLNLRLLLGTSASLMLAACASIDPWGSGDQAGGCRTVYIFTGGSVQAGNTCGALLRETGAAATVTALAEPKPDTPGRADAPVTSSSPQLLTVSAAAAQTAPHDRELARYPGANEMIEAGDMAAFMGRVRADFGKKANAGAWGYMVVDALAADDPATAQTVIDAMSGRRATDWLSANHLRAWVYAFNGRKIDAQNEIMRLRNILPPATLLGHRALLAEGMGDTTAALQIYAQTHRNLDNAPTAEAGAPAFSLRSGAFIAQRLLALRQADLLRALNRDEEAVTLLTQLLAAAPGDSDVVKRIAAAREGRERPSVRTLKQALAQALADEADVIGTQEAFVAMRMSRGGKTPFNHLLSSMRQSALLLDPDNADVRVAEVGRLYAEGKFEPALRLAQIGRAGPEQETQLLGTAALAALQLGSPSTLEAMVERALKIDPGVDAKIQAASTLVSANKMQRALALVDQVIKARGLEASQKVAAHMIAGQAHLQAGDINAAAAAASAAIAVQDDQTTQQFLASMLTEGPRRSEGLAIMRRMLMESPDDTGLMNNLGYSLIDKPASDAELDEGFKLLKEAIRLTPDEPNLLDSLGWAYYQYGNFAEANRFVQMALRAYEPFAHWELSDHMGDIQWRLGNREEAQRHWRESLAAFPPAQGALELQAKLRNGLVAPAPVRRETPEVPREKDTSGTNEI